jgi:hypothetical protein
MASKGHAGRLKLSRLIVKGVLGVDESTIDLDTITVLSGENASGKSSHMAAIRSALGIDRTSLARLTHVGSEEKPSVEVILVGDDREVHVSRKGDDSPEVRERVGDDWRKVPRPGEWLRNLIDVQGANPALWLAMKDEDRATALLEAMPLPGYSREAALAAAGLQDFRLPPIPAGLHPLEDLEQVEAAVFSSRTEVNRQERAESDAAAKLFEGLPAEPPKDLDGQLERAEAKASELASAIALAETETEGKRREAMVAAESAFQLREQKVRADFKADASKLRRTHEEKAAAIRAEAERKVAEDLATTEGAINALREGGEVEINEASKARDAAVDASWTATNAARSELEHDREALANVREHIATLRATQTSIETDRHVRATANEGKAKAEKWAERARELTDGLEALKRYKLKLASSLPIKGLAVHFDDKGRKSLLLDGVPLDQVNRARLSEIAVEVSLLRGRRETMTRTYLPLVLLDDAEKLDPEARAALLRECAARGSQVIAAVVSQTTLRVLRGEDALAETAGAPA